MKPDLNWGYEGELMVFNTDIDGNVYVHVYADQLCPLRSAHLALRSWLLNPIFFQRNLCSLDWMIYPGQRRAKMK